MQLIAGFAGFRIAATCRPVSAATPPQIRHRCLQQGDGGARRRHGGRRAKAAAAAAGAAGSELVEAGTSIIETKGADDGGPVLSITIQSTSPQAETGELSTGKPLISAAAAKARAAELTTVAASLLLYSPVLLEQPAQVGAAVQRPTVGAAAHVPVQRHTRIVVISVSTSYRSF